jgi:hypothetical protein
MTHHSTVALPGNPDMSQYFMSIKVFNKLPGFIADIISDKTRFILTLKKYLIEKSCYSLEDFIND